MTDERADPTLHPLLATRWSPAVFDSTHVATAEQVAVLLEAARWAPSAGNSQPWAFIVGRRGDSTHRRLVRHLAGASAHWAPTASILVANLSHRFVEGTDGDYSEFASYDLGQAVAHMTLQARAFGLQMRQFRSFDRDALALEFDVPAHWEVTTMSAVGMAQAPRSTSTYLRGEPRPHRSRRPANEIRWPA